MATFQERLKQIRKDRNLKQSELAEQIGVSMYTVSVWERGVQMPEFGNLDALCIALNVNLGYLMGTSDDPSPPRDPGDEETAQWVADDEKTKLQELFMYMTRLSERSIRVIKAAVIQAYKEDEYCNELQIGYDVAVTDKVIADGTSDEEADETAPEDFEPPAR